MRRWPGIGLVTIAVILLASIACGKKASPFLPERVMPLRVAKLEAGVEKGTVVLRGIVTAPQGTRPDPGEVTGCRVYYARFNPGDAPCEGCPVEYEGFKVIAGEVITADGFYCRVPEMASKGIHFFEVRLIGREGAVGASSNRAKLTII